MKHYKKIRNAVSSLSAGDKRMNSLRKRKLSAAILMAMGSLYGGQAANAFTIPTIDSTSADIAGTALKGAMQSAEVTIVQLNGSNLSIESDNQTDSSGAAAFSVKGDVGFGINSLAKVVVRADGDTTMLCDAALCGDAKLGEQMTSGLDGLELTTIEPLSVPFASTSDGTADMTFQATALTTIATTMIETDIAEGRNVTTVALLDLAKDEYSEVLLKALGIEAPTAHAFGSTLISADRYGNFVTGEECVAEEDQAVIDENGDPVLDEEGNPVTETVCTEYVDVLVSDDIIKLSFANAAFAALGEFENMAAVLNETAARIEGALLAADQAEALSTLEPLRTRMIAAMDAHPVLAELGKTSLDLVNPELEFLASAGSTGPVREVTTDDALAGATITARNRIGDAESEFKAFDGDPQTKWLDHNDWQGPPSEEDPSWIQVEFEQPEAVNSIFITSANDADARDPENFNIVASNDGENWVTLASFVGESFDERFERKAFTFNNGLTYTHYRLNITKNKGDDSLMQLSEIEFVGPIYVSKDHTDPVGTGTITARNRIGDAESEFKAFDNDPETKWLDHNDWQGPPSVEDPSWVQVEFDEAVAVDTLAITSANDADARDPENFNLQGSNDGGLTWTTLAEFVGESFDARFERKLFSVDNQLAYSTYRLNITKNKGDDSLMQLGEIELIGPTVSGERHSHVAGATYVGRNRISDGESEDKAFDLDVNTKWLDHNDWQGAPTVEDPSWIQITLPDAKAVNTLSITSANDADARDPENFFLEGSYDGETWTRLGEWVGESFDARFERKQWQFGNSLAYPMYQLSITKNKGDDGLMQVAEIELIGPQYASIDHSSSPGVTITARNRIGDAESEFKAFDDDPTTKWLDHNDWAGAPSEEDPSWVQLDFPEAEIVNTLALTSANDAEARDPENFQLLGSNDGGVTWTVVASWVGESFDERFERRVFEFSNGFAYTSYRLNISKNKGDDGLMQIGEIELIGPPSAEPEIE